MKSDKRLKSISEKIQKLIKKYNEAIDTNRNLLIENESLRKEIDDLKKINFEMGKKVEVSKIAGQLSESGNGNEELKKKVDKYIREIDVVIKGLKEL